MNNLKEFREALGSSRLKASLMRMSKRERLAAKLRYRIMNDRAVWSCDGKNWLDSPKAAIDHAVRNMTLWESWQ